jgi:RalA-binding protein 1
VAEMMGDRVSLTNNHVARQEAVNKMSIQSLGIVMSPCLNVSHRLLNAMFVHTKDLFHGVKIKK